MSKSGSRSKRGRRPSRSGLLWVGAAAALVAVVTILFLRLFPPVSWVAVAEAMGRQDTMRGRARIYLSDGSEWEYALWASIHGRGKTMANGMARPVRKPPGQQALSKKPDPALLMLGKAIDIGGPDGIIKQLVDSGHRYVLGRRIELRGQPAIVVEAKTPRRQPSAPGGGPDAWRLVLDPDSKLVLAASASMEEGGHSRLRARCEYEYNLALPPGFKGETR